MSEQATAHGALASLWTACYEAANVDQRQTALEHTGRESKGIEKTVEFVASCDPDQRL